MGMGMDCHSFLRHQNRCLEGVRASTAQACR
jgi:hypothetical protein